MQWCVEPRRMARMWHEACPVVVTFFVRNSMALECIDDFRSTALPSQQFRVPAMLRNFGASLTSYVQGRHLLFHSGDKRGEVGFCATWAFAPAATIELFLHPGQKNLPVALSLCLKNNGEDDAVPAMEEDQYLFNMFPPLVLDNELPESQYVEQPGTINIHED